MSNDHDYRESKLHSLRASATESDRIKIAEIKAETRESAARIYGARISELMVQRLTDSVLISEEATVTIKSNHNQMPQSRKGWNELVKAIAEKDEFISANLTSSDARLIAELRAECMAELTPARSIHLYRTGALDGWLKNQIDARMTARLEAQRGS